MILDVYNLDNQKTGEIEVAEEVFGAPLKEHLHHEVVRAQLASRRRGTVKTKTRAEVSGTTAKMYRQKGTGRARHSSRRAPLFVGGGRAFGPRPRSFDLKISKKKRKGALRSALSDKVRSGSLKVVEDFSLDSIKTGRAVQILKGLETTRALVVDQKSNDKLRLSARNLSKYKYLAPEGLNLYDVLLFDQLVITKAALEQIQGALMP